MRIALVKPCWKYPIAGADHTYNRRWPPLDLLNCAAWLEADGHEVRVVDAQAADLPPEAAAARVGRADMVLLTSSALDRWQCPSLELGPLVAAARALRACTERLILCGFHGTAHPGPMLAMTGADAVIRGEPEETVREIAAGRPWAETPGVTFAREGRTLSTPDRAALDLTRLLAPAYHLVDLREYQYEILGPRFAVLEGSRGCPYACTFCSRLMQGRQVRRKTAAQLAGEVAAVVRCGGRNVYFIDLEFTASPELVSELCRTLIERRIRVRWCCQTRADQVDEPLLRLMKEAGCRLVHFGVESGSPRIIELTRKRITLDQQRRGIQTARRLGIETLCFFLLGYPGETEGEMRETIRLARELNPTYASFHRISPYPGTELHEQTCREATELFPAFAGTSDERAKVDRLVREAIWSYYTRPRYILSRLFGGSPRALWRQLRLFAGYLTGLDKRDS